MDPSIEHARGMVRVGVVDDHAMVASSIAMALAQQPGFEVVGVAGTLAGARRMVADDHPDVLLCDQRLPDGSGVAALPGLKALGPTTNVLLMSAEVPDSVLVTALENGACGFLSKSASVDDLVTAVRAAAAGDVLVSPALLARLLPRLHRERSGVGQDLTAREIEVLRALSRGLSNAAIAAELGISVNTVRNHMQNVLAKLGVHSKLEALSVAVREGIVESSDAGV